MKRRGMTLIELLVVIVIIVGLITVAIPLMSPSSSDRQSREAARGLHAFLQAAQARAIASARPFGVAIKRLSQDTGDAANNGVSVEAFIVEQPKPFSGFDSTSTARLCIDHDMTAQPGAVLIQFNHAIPPVMLRRGDIVEMYGSKYVLDETDSLDANGFYEPAVGTPDGTFAALALGPTAKLPNGKVIPAASLAYTTRDDTFTERFWTQPVSYKIHRQPTVTSDEPYQLPEGSVVDLRASGVGDDLPFYVPGFHDNNGAVIIMFGPSGAVERVAFSRIPDCPTCGSQAIADNIYFLVGPNVPPPPSVSSDATLTRTTWNAAQTDEEKGRLREPINWLRGDSYWISIAASSGRVATNDNSFVDPLAIINDPMPTILASEGTEAMRTRQIVAARKSAMGMEQLGGR